MKKIPIKSITRAENSNLIYLSISVDGPQHLSWEQIQAIKDKYYPNDSFVEVYPPKKEIINKANVRHLFCQKSNQPIDLSIIEQDFYSTIVYDNPEIYIP